MTVPVLKQADRKSVPDIAAEVGTLAASTRQNSLVLADKVQVLPMLPLSLVFDYRVVDGAPAAAFLDAIRTALEKPYLLLT